MPISVALLAEGVDRNHPSGGPGNSQRLVALLAEGVDRNFWGLRAPDLVSVSPSSRRAWIEIFGAGFQWLRFRGSPSSRRAWIEILMRSVTSLLMGGRPPRGGRG